MGQGEPSVTVEMFVPSVEEAARWYEKALEFRIVKLETGVFAAVQFEEAQLFLAAAAHYTEKRASRGAYDHSKVGHGIEIRILVKNVDAFYRKVRRESLPIVLEIETRYYGLRDFIFEDPNGFHIRVASVVKE